MRIKILVLPIILALLWGCKKDAAAPVPAMYFPPVSSTEWETMEPEQAGLNKAKLPELYAFLNQTNTNAFILLKNGRIVLEHYNGNNLSGGNFTASSNWYWASAGKTLTAFLIGKAQEEMYLSINDRTSKYLGSGWSSLTPAQENNITIRHQLSMSTGLDDGIPDNHCTTKNCFTFKAEPGTRWAYHNGPYTILDGVLEKATNQSFDNYFNTRLRNKIGMDGFWTYLGADHVYFSTARAMAKYGLLILNKGKWADEVILQDKTYFEQMTNSSQSINPAYGYLWWLNGKNSFMLPGVQFSFNGHMSPAAPADLIAAIGKNGQFLQIIPSKGIVIVRMGNNPNESEVPVTYQNDLWEVLNQVIQK